MNIAAIESEAKNVFTHPDFYQHTASWLQKIGALAAPANPAVGLGLELVGALLGGVGNHMAGQPIGDEAKHAAGTLLEAGLKKYAPQVTTGADGVAVKIAEEVTGIKPDAPATTTQEAPSDAPTFPGDSQ